MSKCQGCGINLQNENPNELGYTSNLDNIICERCFRIKNYNEYKKVSKESIDFIKLLNEINNSNDLVILVVDLFNIKKFDIIKKYINNNIILVLTKNDILPNVYEERIKKYFNTLDLNIVDVEIISSKKNYNFDNLYNKIIKHKLSNNVYVIGYTNAGKSTMINKLLYNYSNNKLEITTSPMPNTTIDKINIILDDNLTLIDTPGLLSNGDIINFIDYNLLKKVIPSKKLKPLSYNIKTYQTFFIDNIVRLEIESNNSIVFYISNLLKVDRVYKENNKLKNLKKHEINVDNNNDVVIEGLGFIKIVKKCRIVLYTIDGVNVFTRRSLI